MDIIEPYYNLQLAFLLILAVSFFFSNYSLVILIH